MKTKKYGNKKIEEEYNSHIDYANQDFESFLSW